MADAQDLLPQGCSSCQCAKHRLADTREDLEYDPAEGCEGVPLRLSEAPEFVWAGRLIKIGAFIIVLKQLLASIATS